MHAGDGHSDGTQQPMNPLMGMIDIETDPQTINGFTEVCGLPFLDHVRKDFVLCHCFSILLQP